MGELAAVGVALAWAVSTLIFSRLGVTVRPLVLAAVKCTGALVLMALTLAVADGSFWPAGVGVQALGILTLSGLLGLTLGDSAHFLALVRLGPRRTLILAALTPVATALLAALFLAEPVGLATALGIALTLGGVGIVLYERAPGGARRGLARAELAGVLFALFAVGCNAVANILAKLGGEGVSALGVSVVRLAAGAVGLHLLLAATGRHPEAIRPLLARRTAVPLLAATVIGSYLGIWSFMWALGHAQAGIVTTLAATSPVFVLIIGRVLLGEAISARAALGTAAAVAGVGVLFLA